MLAQGRSGAQRIQAIFSEKTIDELSLQFGHGRLNLEPGFQRRSVWSLSDRRRLIQSILSSYPLPSIFLYQRNTKGNTIYDVIDGKQRLETIFMFMRRGRFRGDAFDIRFDRGDGLEHLDWSDISRDYGLKAAFTTYKIPVIEVTGNLADIVDLFVRINSTGKPLTPGEKRHARFFDSRFLKEADRLVGRYKAYLLREKIMTPGQLERMKGTELFSEILMSLHHGGIINKKTALDRAIGNDSVNGNTLHRLTREFVKTMNTMKKVFPELRSTRFRNSAEFYSLFLLIWELERDRFVLKDWRRNRIAERLLRRLSTGVDELRDRLRRAQPATSVQRLYSEYLLTVQGDTDSAASRTRRAEILRGLLSSLFAFKDDKRLFTAEQRRILWNSDEAKKCPSCKKRLTWSNFAVDHVLAHTKGGKTKISNAQLLCRKCNSRKGGR